MTHRNTWIGIKVWIIGLEFQTQWWTHSFWLLPVSGIWASAQKAWHDATYSEINTHRRDDGGQNEAKLALTNTKRGQERSKQRGREEVGAVRLCISLTYHHRGLLHIVRRHPGILWTLQAARYMHVIRPIAARKPQIRFNYINTDENTYRTVIHSCANPSFRNHLNPMAKKDESTVKLTSI